MGGDRCESPVRTENLSWRTTGGLTIVDQALLVRACGSTSPELIPDHRWQLGTDAVLYGFWQILHAGVVLIPILPVGTRVCTHIGNPIEITA